MRNLVKSDLKYGDEGSNKERNKNEEINLFEPINEDSISRRTIDKGNDEKFKILVTTKP